MYYGRFSRKSLDEAVANEVITPEERVQIENFYESNTFILKGKPAVDTLRLAIPDIVQVNYDSEQDLYFMRVEKWPHIKEMCLRNARTKPCNWRYVNQDDQQTIFEYHLDKYSILCPSSSFF